MSKQKKIAEKATRRTRVMTHDFTLYAPISKINEEKRTVGGWATTEDIDKQSEVVDYLGSKEAFANWQGNIREMHEPKAVGKAVEVIPNDGEKKIWVEAYVSKGAEDTWQKIKEGILTGFSIGGQTIKKTQQFLKDMSSGDQKMINRILKYRLNELSLVDNPANPLCSFALVKSVDGVPYQTEIVEDVKKFIITEVEDPLKTEVTEHREKADALVKKVLDQPQLEHLGDDDFGIIRKHEANGIITKERLLPMPDKVHAVRALEVMTKYNVTDSEKEVIHKKAKEILGSAYDTYKSNSGGTEEVSNETLNKLVELIDGLAKKVETLEKAFEGAHKPVPGAKETPKDAPTTPSLGESGAASAPTVVASKETPKDAPTTPAVGESAPTEAGAADSVRTEDKAPKVEAAPKVAEAAVAESAPAEAGAADGVQTQPPAGDYPKKVVKVEAEIETADVEKKDDKKDEDSKEEAKETKAEEKVDEEEKKKETKKSTDGSENDLSKVLNVVESLSKRLDGIDERLKKPMPRKSKIEKNLDETETSADAELQKRIDTVLEWNRTNKALTSDEMKFKEVTLDLMLAKKNISR